MNEHSKGESPTSSTLLVMVPGCAMETTCGLIKAQNDQSIGFLAILCQIVVNKVDNLFDA
jgi:hypothetical protein